jgi:hypothetical protein
MSSRYTELKAEFGVNKIDELKHIAELTEELIEEAENEIDIAWDSWKYERDRYDKLANKIKEKIKELESEEPADDDYNFELQNDIHSKIDVLKELLKGE